MQHLPFNPGSKLVGVLASLLILVAIALTLTPNPLQRQSGSTALAVFPDYLQRSQIIATYEAQVRESPDSFLRFRLLAAQYLRRFREQGDMEDLLRSEQAARRSLAIQPRQPASSLLLASTLLSQHRFQEALEVVTAAQELVPENADVLALRASIELELGHYEVAQQQLQLLARQADLLTDDLGQSAIAARYLELTGDLDGARQQLEALLPQVDAFYANPAETRAWFHVRAGDLAFATGDLARSEQRYREALRLFPDAVAAFTGLARLYAAQHRWPAALTAATQGSDRVPLVELLGYKADAQRALGDREGAATTAGLIEVVAHLSQIQGIYDRALAIYDLEHDIHLPEALAIAQREIAIRDDIYAEDTLAWAAAANGQCQVAQQAAQRAARYGTEDALLQFHQGMIARQCGDREAAIAHLQQALRRNPQFHHQYAAVARQVVTELTQAAAKTHS